MKKRLLLILSALLILSLCACSAVDTPQQDATDAPAQEITAAPQQEATAAPEQEATEAPQQLTDMMDRPVQVVQNPEKIVSLSASNTEILFAIGLGDKIVGIDAFSEYPEETADIEKVGDFSGPNIEAVTALAPEIVFTSNKMQIDTIEALEALDINVAAIEATAYNDIDDSILLIGRLTGAEEQAQAVVDAMQAQQEQILSLEVPQEEVSCYYIMSAGEYGNWTSGPGSFVNDMMLMLGIRPVTDIEVSAPWMDFNLETLVASDPDILLLSTDAFLTVEDLAQMNGYADLTAVKEGRVYMIDPDLLNPGPRIVDGLQAMYDAAYGN